MSAGSKAVTEQAYIFYGWTEDGKKRGRALADCSPGRGMCCEPEDIILAGLWCSGGVRGCRLFRYLVEVFQHPGWFVASRVPKSGSVKRYKLPGMPRSNNSLL